MSLDKMNLHFLLNAIVSSLSIRSRMWYGRLLSPLQGMYDSFLSIITGQMSTSSLNTFPLSTWNAAEAFRLAIVSTLLKYNSIILRICFRKIMEKMIKIKRQKSYALIAMSISITMRQHIHHCFFIII